MDPLLRLHTSVLDDIAVVRLCGELDLSGSAELLERLAPALSLADHAVVIDLSGLTFMDCAGTSALVDARTEIARSGVELALAAPTRPVARLLSLTGTGRLIPIFRTVRQAVNRYHHVTTAQGTRTAHPSRTGGLRRPGLPVPPRIH